MDFIHAKFNKRPEIWDRKTGRLVTSATKYGIEKKTVVTRDIRKGRLSDLFYSEAHSDSNRRSGSIRNHEILSGCDYMLEIALGYMPSMRGADQREGSAACHMLLTCGLPVLSAHCTYLSDDSIRLSSH